MEIRELKIGEMEQIYDAYLVKDFPKDERKPFGTIRRIYEEGLYRGLGFYETGQMKAYAFLCDDIQREFCLLDYYAVLDGLRGKGFGQKAMARLREFCTDRTGLIIESENPAFAKGEEDRSVRERRIAFYEKCGLRLTQVRGMAFGVEYKILYAPCKSTADDERVGKALSQIYRMLVPEPAHSKYIRISF